MIFKLYINIFIVLLTIGSVFTEFPANIEKCHYGDVDCIKRVATDVLQKNPHDLEALKLPDLEPFHLDNATFTGFHSSEVNPEIYQVDFGMRDFDLYGLSKFVFDRFVGFEKNPTTSKFEFYGKIPNVMIKSKYKITGRMLGLPIEGDGPLEVHVGNVAISVKVKVKEAAKKDGKTYIKVDKHKALIEAKSFKIQLGNLFNGNKALGDSMNALLNQNWEVIWGQMQPNINRIVGKIVVDILDDLSTILSYEDIFLP